MTRQLQPNRAMHFDGVGWVDFTPPVSLNSASVFAVSFWASAASYGLNKVAVAIREGGSSSSAFLIYPYDLTTGDGARVFHTGGTIIDQNNSSVAADETQNHFLFISRSAIDHELFVNGASAGTSSVSNTLPSALDNITVGAWKSTDQHYIGDIRDLRIYDASNLPTAQEIIDLADPIKTKSTALNTVAHYKGETILDVAGGVDTVYDSSGNANHGTATTGVTTVETGDYSFANEVGYSDGTTAEGLILPRDESSVLLDALGGPLDYSGSIFPLAFTDNFTGTNGTLLTAHTPDIDSSGNGWTVLQGTEPTLDGSGMVVFDAADVIPAFEAMSDGVVSCVVDPSNDGTSSGPIFRMQDALNYLTIFFRGSDGLTRLRIRSAGSYNTPVSYTLSGYVPGTPVTIKVKYAGTSIKVDVNGVVDAIDTTRTEFQTETWVGFRSSATHKLDQFGFDPLPVPQAAITPNLLKRLRPKPRRLALTR